MEKILSQDEIDALLNGVVSGEVETAPPAEAEAETTTGVKGYDLLNQELSLIHISEPTRPY